MFTGPYLWIYGLVAGDVENSTVSIVKRGDWRAQYRGIRLGTQSGSSATFVNESGNMLIEGSAGVKIAEAANSTGVLETISGDWSIAGELRMGCASGSSGTFVVKGGNVTILGSDLRLSSGGSGTLTIEGGKVTVADNTKSVYQHSGPGTVNLNGGTLETACIYRNQSNITVNFNGGTLKANGPKDIGLLYSKNNTNQLFVNINAGGGVIDSGNYAFSIGVPGGLNGTGGLTFTGGNTITIDCNINYSGVTRIVLGTTLKLTKARVSSILSKGIELIGAPVVGTAYTILTSTAEEDDWSDLDFSKVTCPLMGAVLSTAVGADG